MRKKQFTIFMQHLEAIERELAENNRLWREITNYPIAIEMRQTRG